MTNQEFKKMEKDLEDTKRRMGIISSVFNKAIANGWYPSYDEPEIIIHYPLTVHTMYLPAYTKEEIRKAASLYLHQPVMFLNKEFARCVWGSEMKKFLAITDPEITYTQRNFEHHLQQMVLADDIIDYLEKNAL
jgi:hypothetical protein